MRLKVLIVPTFLALTLILIIGYIKPDINEIFTKRTDIATQNELLSKVSSTIEHTASLNSSLDREKKSEDFLLQYLPATLTEDQTVNDVSYLASQAGLVVSEMDLKKATEVATVNIAPDGSVIESSSTSDIKTFQFAGSVLGSYENIKKFFGQVTHMNRFQKVQLFSIQKNEQAGATSNTTDLKGTFVIDFGYLPNKPVASALDIPIFRSTELNFSDVATLQEKTTSVPPLEMENSGKPNPFQ